MAPIRPEEKARYPHDWDAITARIRARAHDRCECTGECGSDHGVAGRCAVPNRAIILRGTTNPAEWTEHDGCSLCLGGDDECRPVRVVLTIAHLDQVPEHVDPANLKALCQRCHLLLDRDQHRVNAAATRARKSDAASGQVSLFSNGASHGPPPAKAEATSSGVEASPRSS